jgi:8-oxo-dGTP pyrophosphatase MutT (NUDIX family)
MGRQMYEIYINETKIVLLPSSEIKENFIRDDNNLVVRYTGKVTHLLNFIDLCEKTTKQESIIIHHMNYNKLKKDFVGLFKVVEAAGGAVVNERNQVLMIHRRGHWDLPKGKLEKGEKRRDAAIREVIEETGIDKVEIVGKKLIKTYHSFLNKKGIRCIKLSHWYLMKGKHQPLTPQIEEGIDECRWMTLENFYSKDRIVFSNILSVLNKVKTNKIKL